MKTDFLFRKGIVFASALLIAGIVVGRVAAEAPAEQTSMDRAIDALIKVLGDPRAADGDHLQETNRAIQALVKIGKPAVPKLIDAVLGDNTYAAAYGGLALKEMPATESREAVQLRWERLSVAERWRLVRFVTDLHFNAITAFALECLKNPDETIRQQAWAFVIQHRQAALLAPAKEPYLKALAGDESPTVRWGLLTENPIFDAEKEAAILIGLLRVDGWAAKGEKRIFCCTTPPWFPDGRDLVIPILGKRKVKQAVPALLNVLGEKGPGRAYLGHLIIPILGELGDKEAIPELKRILNMPSDKHERTLWGSDYLHAIAAEALMQLGDPAGRAGCLELLKSKEGLASGRAALAFARFGTKDDLDVLGKLLDDESWQIRREVCRGLERITGVVNRAPGWVETTENDAPLWKEWLRKNRKGGGEAGAKE